MGLPKDRTRQCNKMNDVCIRSNVCFVTDVFVYFFSSASILGQR